MAVRIENHAEPIPGYKLIERLGGGGFGEVWKCEAPGGLHKAIKFVYGDLSSAGDNGVRAEQELKALSRVKTVRHPYILSLERFDIIDGQLMIVMELADRNLWDRFKECRAQGLPGIPRGELLSYMAETAEALDLMNTQYQLQHLDIKPQNLFLVHQHVKVADFGLVKDLEGMAASVTGGVTPVYAAPETFDGWVSRFSDQYSLGIVYQELLTGQRPFSGNNVRQLVLQHLQQQPNLTPLPPEDQLVIARALAKKPEERHPSCMDVVVGLRHPGGEPRVPAAPGAPAAPPNTPTSGGLEDAAASTSGTAPTARLKPRDGGSSQGQTQPLPGHEEDAAGATTAPPPEVRGEGDLFPAVVVGVGQAGLTVLQHLRDTLAQRFGAPDALPNVRLLLLDSDPGVLRSAPRGGGALGPNEIFLAQLNRPSHYLKLRDGRTATESWLNPRMLYRIPRSQLTTGVRALGRLAFYDHYRAVARRLHTELHEALEPAALSAAAQRTQLGARSNRPRVYIVAGLAGGTGGGMFLDLAYLARRLLRLFGYEQPAVHGLFLVPSVRKGAQPAGPAAARVQALGNSAAALTELNYFAGPGTAFTARYVDREAPVHDTEPPFTRYHILSLPPEGDEAAARELAGMAAEFLGRDLTSPLGREADLARAGVEAPPWAARGQHYHAFGLYRFSFPRRQLVRLAARALCRRVVQRWMSKDSRTVEQAVRDWVQGQCQANGLGADTFVEALQQACERALGRAPEDALADAVAPVVEQAAALRKGDSGIRFGAAVLARPPAPAEIDPLFLEEALRRVEQLVWRPDEEGVAPRASVLGDVLRDASDALVHNGGQKLSEMLVGLIEQPEFRLAGAEAAIRQLVTALDQVIEGREPVYRELATKAGDALQRLCGVLDALVRGPAGRRGVLSAGDAAELLRVYPKWRYQSLVMQHTLRAFVSLRGYMSDQLREVNFCRARMGELARSFEDDDEDPEGSGWKPGTTPSGGLLRSKEEPRKPAPAPVFACPGKVLLPSGCRDVGEAMERLLASVTAEVVEVLDGRMQALLREQFQSLIHVCLGPGNVLRNVEPALQREAERFVEETLSQTNAAELFLDQYADEQAASDALQAAFDEAEPETGGGSGRRSEVCVLAVPAGDAGDRVRALARKAIPEVDWIAANSPDDILVYRERPNLPLSGLDLLGPSGQEAYRLMLSAEHFTPHTRTDVPFSL